MAEHNKSPTSGKTSTQNTASPEHNPARKPVPPQRQNLAITTAAGSTDSAKDEDLVYKLVRREVPNYPSLDRGPPPYSPRSESGPAGTEHAFPSQAFDFSRPSTSTSSSPQGTRAAYPASDNTRPEPGSFQHQQPAVSPNRRTAADSANEIVELQPRAPTAEDRQREAEERKAEGGRTAGTEEEVTNIPNTNFAIACMVTLCFNLPLGILAMYFSLKAVLAFQQGHRKLGEKRSRWSIVCSLLGIAITTVLVSSIVLYIAMQGQRRIKQYKAYSVKAGLSL